MKPKLSSTQIKFNSKKLFRLLQAVNFFTFQVAPAIKARMQSTGSMLVGYQPQGDHVNFFRMVTANPSVTRADMDHVVNIISTYGEELSLQSTHVIYACSLGTKNGRLQQGSQYAHVWEAMQQFRSRESTLDKGDFKNFPKTIQQLSLVTCRFFHC